MIIPYRIKVAVARVPWLNYVIMATCVVSFVAMVIGIIPPILLDLLVARRWNPVGLIGHQFLHGSLFHIFFNMVFLWVFGNFVCAKIGNLAFTPVYLAAGIAGAVAQMLVSPYPLVGASGAISGIIAFCLVLSPTGNIRCLYYCGLFGGIFSVHMFWMILLWFGRDVWFAVFMPATQIAHWAHVGGFVCGFAIAAGLIKAGLIEKLEGDGPTLLDYLGGKWTEPDVNVFETRPSTSLASLEFQFSSPIWMRWCVGLSLLLSYPVLYSRVNFNTAFLPLFGALQIAPSIADWFGGLAGGVLWRHTEGKPTPIYGIAKNLAGSGKYVEAEAEYEKIIEEFPDETQPHIDLIDIALKRLNDPALAEQFYNRGMETLRKEKGRNVLRYAYQRALELQKSSRSKEPAVIAYRKRDAPPNSGEQTHG